MRPETIAIDGPAGSGKSTIGQALAARLHYAMVDTGLIYRLVARAVLDSAVDPDDMEAVLKVAVVRTAVSSACENWNWAPGQDCLGSSIHIWSW